MGVDFGGGGGGCGGYIPHVSARWMINVIIPQRELAVRYTLDHLMANHATVAVHGLTVRVANSRKAHNKLTVISSCEYTVS